MKVHEKSRKPLALSKAIQRAKFLIEVRCDPLNSSPSLKLGNSPSEHAASLEAIELLVKNAERSLE